MIDVLPTPSSPKKSTRISFLLLYAEAGGPLAPNSFEDELLLCFAVGSTLELEPYFF